MVMAGAMGHTGPTDRSITQIDAALIHGVIRQRRESEHLSLHRTRPAAIFGLLMVTTASVALAQTMSTYGTPGLVETPTAEMLNEDELALTSSVFNNTQRHSLTFQFLPRINATFRYSLIDDFIAGNDRLADRSFDVNILLAKETRYRPALLLGLRDIVGTGVYSSEYLVATKTMRPGLRFSAGVGWGRLGDRGVENPLGVLKSELETRPPPSKIGASTGGTLDPDAWFRGDMGFFGGVSWDVTQRLTLSAEYSSDRYTLEETRGAESIDDPWNIGVNYRFDSGISLGAFLLGGDEVGVQLGYSINPGKPSNPGGIEAAAPALMSTDQVAAASWNLPDAPASDGAREVLRSRLAEQGLRMEGLDSSGSRAVVHVQNNRWQNEAQAAGRTARVMANTLPPEVTDFEIVFRQNGVPLSRVRMARADLLELEHDVDGAWRSYARADIEDAARAARPARGEVIFPEFSAELVPFLTFSFFDPDEPLRYEVGPELRLDYKPAPGLKFATAIRYPVAGTIDDSNRPSDSVLPRVRSEAFRYAQESEVEISQMTASYVFRPGKDLFGRISGGYLETMFGGVSGELLWHPVNSRLALGVEVNYARQRDFDVLFGFQDYDVVTGHASAYYELNNGFHAQIDAGRYLAKDWGATFTLMREFDNGFRIGGFFTLTDVSFDDFGEGSFDKGFIIEVPIAWMTGQPSRQTVSNTIRPLLRDGGARLDVPDRLYDLSRDYRAESFEDGWGRFFR